MTLVNNYMKFKNRQAAGQKLIPQLDKYQGDSRVIILGLPRGGVVIASEIAKALKLPLDLMVTRKIGAPNNPELAIGAISEDGAKIFDENLITAYQISQEYIDKEVAKEKKEAQRRQKAYRGDSQPLDLKDKIVILADDGVATGATIRAAIASAKKKGALKIIVAAPVIAKEVLITLKKEADEVVYLEAPAFFSAVGEFYEDFEPVEDEEVVKRLKI